MSWSLPISWSLPMSRSLHINWSLPKRKRLPMDSAHWIGPAHSFGGKLRLICKLQFIGKPSSDSLALLWLIYKLWSDGSLTSSGSLASSVSPPLDRWQPECFSSSTNIPLILGKLLSIAWNGNANRLYIRYLSLLKPNVRYHNRWITGAP